MSAVLSIYDEVAGLQPRAARFTLTLASERITARELIARRVREEVAAYNANRSEHFHGLVQPTDSEQVLNGYRMRRVQTIDADAQVTKALDAFERNAFLLLVNDRQLESLDEPIVLADRADVTFLKLVPLVGG